MSTRRLLAPALSLTVLVGAAGCSSDGDQQPTSPTPAGGAGTTVGPPADELADAEVAVVEFFEAKAVNDYDRALSRASGAAAVTVEWARNVNSIDAAEGSPYAVPPDPAPNVRVQIDRLEATGADTWQATGFIELGFRPSGVASTTTTADTTLGGSTGLPDTVFVTDLVFTRDGPRMKLDDFRLDDTPYPVSQLFVDVRGLPGTAGPGTTQGGPSGTTTRTGGVNAELELGHRDLDGSVQYEFALGGEAGAEASRATFFAGAATPPPADVTGAPVDVLADPTEGPDRTQGLAVRPGAFPGQAGILRVVFTAATGVDVGQVDLTVPPFPALEARPVDTVRERISSTTTSSSTTSTSSPTSSTTTSTTSSTVTVPTTPASPTTTRTVPTSPTTSTTRPTTTSSSTTSTTTR